ncbi:BglG family transcription antiterminator [Shouchella shacheensis]|uniref:BglG family transcription antiterminator n=1 Tax=Shouchella shacheensis TaxID=1649580 RepID=UPI0007402666|nr:BglG family transcription antiterminator [Shouchella shacheensis]
MNERQKTILLFLMEQQEFVSVTKVASKTGCSEKTVRNDFKVIDSMLAQTKTGNMIRKPSVGVRIDMEEEERVALKKEIHPFSADDTNSPAKRQLDIARKLLEGEKRWTIRQLSEVFYESTAVIRQDLEELATYFQTFDVELALRPNVGIRIEGEELSRRMLLADIVKREVEEESQGQAFTNGWFSPFEWEAVKKILRTSQEEAAFTENSLKTLTIHILLAVKRIKQKQMIELDHEQLENERVKPSFKQAASVAKELQAFFLVKWPASEVAYLSFHLGSAKLDLEHGEWAALPISDEVSDFTSQLIQTVAESSSYPFTNDRDLYKDVATHLHSSLNRLEHRLSMRNPMMSDIRKMYPYLFEITLDALKEIKPAVHWPLDEAAYLTIHFQVALERLKKWSGENKRVLIVCPMGVGMARLLRTKLTRTFHSLKIVASVSTQEIGNYSESEIDFIISTVPLQETAIPVVHVSPFLKEEEQRSISETMKTRKRARGTSTLAELIGDPTNIVFINESGSDRLLVIKSLANRLVEKGSVDPSYTHSALKREMNASTYIGGGVAIPHGDPKFIHRQEVLLGVLPKPMDWTGKPVALVLLLATNLKEGERVKRLFEEISALSDQPELVQRLSKEKDPQTIFSLL